MAIVRVHEIASRRNGNWARRVGCKKSIPTRNNARAVKKTQMLAELIDDDSEDSFTSTARWPPVSHQTIEEEMMSDFREATIEINFSTERGHSNLQDMHLQQDPSQTLLSGEGSNSNLQDMPLYDNMDKIHFSADGDNSLAPDIPLHHFSVMTHFSAEGGDSLVPDMPLQLDTAMTNFPSEGGNLDLQNMSLDHDAAMNHFSAAGGDSVLPDVTLQLDATKGFNDIEEDVNMWACHVCKEAEAIVTVLPCWHLCLCLDCEVEWDKCPVCGGSKDGSFYIRN